MRVFGKAVSSFAIAAGILVVLGGTARAANTFKKFQAVGGGTLTWHPAFTDCATLTCNAGLCFCFTFDGNVVGNVIGASTLSLQDSQSASATPDGNGSDKVFPSSGFGIITTSSGDTVLLEFTGHHYLGSDGLSRLIEGAYQVTGGTGKFANTKGAGNIIFTQSVVSLTGTLK
jgi:hypothetical protein